jgi:hypothetical protein
MDFMEFHRYEMDAATYVSPYEKWVARVEKILGHDLDGDQKRDGYSLDFALIEFEKGVSAKDYARSISAQ